MKKDILDINNKYIDKNILLNDKKYIKNDLRHSITLANDSLNVLHLTEHIRNKSYNENDDHLKINKNDNNNRNNYSLIDNLEELKEHSCDELKNIENIETIYPFKQKYIYIYNVRKADNVFDKLSNSKKSLMELQINTESRTITFIPLLINEPREIFSCAAIIAKETSKLGIHLKIQTSIGRINKRFLFLSLKDRIDFLNKIENGKVMLRNDDDDDDSSNNIINNNNEQVNIQNNRLNSNNTIIDTDINNNNNNSNNVNNINNLNNYYDQTIRRPSLFLQRKLSIEEPISLRMIGKKNKNDFIKLLNGEKINLYIQRVTNLVIVAETEKAVQGMLTITNYRLYFNAYDSLWGFCSFEIPIACIDDISKEGLVLNIVSKDFRLLRLAMHDAYTRKHDFDQLPTTPDPRWIQSVITVIKSFIIDINNIFAFQYYKYYISDNIYNETQSYDSIHNISSDINDTKIKKEKKSSIDLSKFSKYWNIPECIHIKRILKSNGWEIYSAIAEYKRLGFHIISETNSHIIDDAENNHLTNDILDGWKMYNNNNFLLSPTYPKDLIFPSHINEEMLFQSARFRSKGRLPVVTWRHPTTDAVLIRSSQPNYGMAGNKCEADRILLQAYRNTTIKHYNIIKMKEYEENAVLDDCPELSVGNQKHNNNLAQPKLYIIDARKPIATKGNRLKGKGVENSLHYDGAVIEFMGIANIHKMRESIEGLKSLVIPSLVDEGDKHFHSRLENTRWLHHVLRLLTAGSRVAEILHEERSSVLVHCSDGWDRTPQIMTLAQLILDPFYRTIRGFAVLIEKEWCSFGHKFWDRIGIGKDSTMASNERSPVMIQWLDCVWQLIQQFPNLFEFNEEFLLFLADSLFSGLYGNFLFNFEKERIYERLTYTTQSIWYFVFKNHLKFINTNYSRSERIIYPRLSLKKIKLWEGFYFRHDPESSLKWKEFYDHCSDSIFNHSKTNKSTSTTYGGELEKQKLVSTVEKEVKLVSK